MTDQVRVYKNELSDKEKAFKEEKASLQKVRDRINLYYFSKKNKKFKTWITKCEILQEV